MPISWESPQGLGSGGIFEFLVGVGRFVLHAPS
jgi:hypothetical protein